MLPNFYQIMMGSIPKRIQIFYELKFNSLKNRLQKNKNKIIIILFYFYKMLSNVNPLCQSELEMINQFSLGLQTVNDVIKNQLSNTLKLQKIAINKSPLLNVPLFCFRSKNDPNQMSIKEFLNRCIDRWSQEALYQQEIINLKDQIIEEFDVFCNQMVQKNLIETARKQRDQLIETLYIKTNFDKKQLAGEFCKSFMNGFEIEMIEKIEHYATYVVWMPYTTPLPEKLIEFVKKILHEKTNEAISEASVINASAKIIQFVQDQLEEREIQIQKKILKTGILLEQKNIVTIDQLGQLLDVAEKSRKTCSLIIDDISNDNMMISNERTKIQTIILRMSANKFLKTSIPFVYERLDLKNLEDKDNFKQTIQILQRLPKCLKSANLQFKNAKQNEIKINNKEREQKHTYELSFAQDDISYNQMKFLARFCNNLQLPLSVIISNFQYKPWNKGSNDEIITLSNVFTHFKAFQHLELNFYTASITTSAIDHLATSITKMNQMKYLNFHFDQGKNSANNNSMGLFAEAISEMPNLHHLELDFSCGNNEITDDGVIQLSRAITKFACIQQLILYFESNGGYGGNAVTDKGIEELSKSIAHLNSAQQLKLIFSNGNHQISDKGMQALATALKNTNQILDLHLNFEYGKNSITDTSMSQLADALKEMLSELIICLDFRSSNSPRVTWKGESVIKNVRTYRSVEFYRQGQKLR